MPETKTHSVQVDAAALAKVQDAAEVLGSTQRIAASLLIETADMDAVLKRHHAAMRSRLEKRRASQPGQGRPTQAGAGSARPTQ